MEEIKAIETYYNGYRFRSRLEARWAVFFDAAGIKYEYEPEGFTLSDGTRYLPDFYLPDVHILDLERKGLWCDVKSGKDGEDYSKILQFSADINRDVAILLPFNNNTQNAAFVIPYQGVDGYDPQIEYDSEEDNIHYGFTKCSFCNEISFGDSLQEYHKNDCDKRYRELRGKAKEILDYIFHDHKINTKQMGMDEIDELTDLLKRFTVEYHNHSDTLEEAVLKAKQARFEFGEHGL